MDVSQTAYWMAHIRALESKRTDALFRDPFAAELSGEIGARFHATAPRASYAISAVVTRTFAIDQILLSLIREEKIDTVVNLAAGLDCRPYRLNLPNSFLWIEADQSSLNLYKESKIQSKTPFCQLLRWDVDFTQNWSREKLFERIRETCRDRKVLVLSEGLLQYLRNTEVLPLIEQINQTESIRYWLFDFFGPKLRNRLNEAWANNRGVTGDLFHFAPENGGKFFAPFGWRLLEQRSIFLESIKLKRKMPLSNLFHFLYQLFPASAQEQMRNQNGVALIEKRLDQSKPD